MTKAKTDPRVDKRRVTMRSAEVVPGMKDGEGRPLMRVTEAVDYVRPDFLAAYVADAKTRWQDVEVSEEPDAGPGGYHGQTAVSDRLDHPLAGQVFPATKED